LKLFFTTYSYSIRTLICAESYRIVSPNLVFTVVGLGNNVNTRYKP